MKAILLIGGFGTRLRPLTLTQPKALLPVLNRPFLAYQLDLLQEAAVSDVMLACGKHSRLWAKDLQALAPRKMKIHFAFEPHPLGTGGAIRFAYDALQKIRDQNQEPVLVFNGDVFFDLSVHQFLRFHASNNSSCTLALTRVKDPSQFGLVEIDTKGCVRRFLEKPKPPFSTHLINAGAYLMNPDWVRTIPRGSVVSVERESFPKSLANGSRMFGFPMKGYWNDIGTHQSYLQAHKDILSTRSRWTQQCFFRKRGHLQPAPRGRGKFLVGEKSSIHTSAVFEGIVCCGNRVVIEEGAVLKDCVVLDDCRIGKRALIQGAVLGRSCRIGAHAQIREGSVLGDKTLIPSYTRY